MLCLLNMHTSCVRPTVIQHTPSCIQEISARTRTTTSRDKSPTGLLVCPMLCLIEVAAKWCYTCTMLPVGRMGGLKVESSKSQSSKASSVMRSTAAAPKPTKPARAAAKKAASYVDLIDRSVLCLVHNNSTFTNTCRSS